MSDIFSLVPDGQAWTDYNAKPATKEDYDPKLFSGSLTAIPQGVASGTVGLGQTVTSFGKQLISDPGVMSQFAPSYGAVKALFPDADQALNSSYDSAAAALTAAQKSVKPEANSQGTAAQVLYGLGQFVPAIGATIAAGPAAGGAIAFGSTFEPTRQEFVEKGVDVDTANTLAAIQGTANAFGMALPAGVGGTLATRLLSGIGINTGFGMANRFAIGETLEDHGYKDLAQQYRAWDGQAMLIDGVLGAAFGAAHHWSASRSDGDTIAANPIDETIQPDVNGPAVLSEPPLTGQGDSSVISESAVPSGSPSDSSVSYESRVAELQELAANLLPVSERKNLAEEIHKAEYSLSQIDDKRQALRDQNGGNSSSRRIIKREISALDQQASEINARLESQRQDLASSSRGGQFFDAKADLSRLEQGIIPESMRGLVGESAVKPSDVDAAHVMNEGLYYDIEASPVLHGTTESLNAHVAAMDEASRALMNGEPVNVSQHIRGLDGITRPDALAEAPEQHAAIRRALDDSGVDYSDRPEPPVITPDIRQDSAFLRAGNEAEQISTDPETGAVISSNSYDLLAARDMASVNPETKILHPDTGKEVSLSEALADLDGQIATAQKESKVYSAAAACFLRNV
jgi:hypothetical protein